MMTRCVAIGVAVIACAVVCFAQTTKKPNTKCYVCSPCATTDGVALSECQPAQNWCYKELRDDGSITRSCAVNCTAGTWTVNKNTYSVNCCADKDGCNTASGLSVSTLGFAASLLAVIAAFDALRRH